MIAQPANPPTARLVTPTVADNAALSIPAKSVNLRMSDVRKIAFSTPAKRRTIQAPNNASKVFPMAITAEVAAVPAVVRFTRKAPSSIAGQTPYPRINTAASAIPEFAQTAVRAGIQKRQQKSEFARGEIDTEQGGSGNNAAARIAHSSTP